MGALLSATVTSGDKCWSLTVWDFSKFFEVRSLLEEILIEKP